MTTLPSNFLTREKHVFVSDVLLPLHSTTKHVPLISARNSQVACVRIPLLMLTVNWPAFALEIYGGPARAVCMMYGLLGGLFRDQVCDENASICFQIAEDFQRSPSVNFGGGTWEIFARSPELYNFILSVWMEVLQLVPPPPLPLPLPPRYRSIIRDRILTISVTLFGAGEIIRGLWRQ